MAHKVAKRSFAQELIGPSTSRYYDENAAEYTKRTVDADMSTLRNRFMAMLPNGGRVLDAGCGSGRDLAVFQQRGFDAIGIDASSAMAKIAMAYAGAPCLVGRLEEVDFEERFDGIWACASLLHIPKTMLVPTLLRLHRSLVPGGRLFVAVQEGEGEGFARNGRFFSYFRSKEIEGHIRDAGFVSIQSICTAGVLPSTRPNRWINVFARRQTRRPVRMAESVPHPEGGQKSSKGPREAMISRR
jgi:SAM-dependent methyltransferase